MEKCGKFVISLDFELLWGVRDKKTIEQYGENIRNVHQVIPKLLALFQKYEVKATFSTVGFLFFENKAELNQAIPSTLPDYENKNLSPYNGHFDLVGNSYEEDQYHFAPQLIKQIKIYPEQEIGTHTFSHYYCLEKGQTTEAFKADLQAAIKVATKNGTELKSLVFPRNQFNESYLKVCKALGIICYRGNETSWLYKAKDSTKETLFRRALRLLDTYINLSGHNCHTDEYMKEDIIANIPASRFLRPLSKKLSFLDGLRLKRIKNAMTHAAKNNLCFHLWWHPHNFGQNQNENFLFLEKILKHHQILSEKYNFKSYTMTSLAKALLNER
jgi:peptidoglycan/xylan/chitin deacetylase (PgdA/CDA1 family)